MITKHEPFVGLPRFTDAIDRLDGRIPGKTMMHLIRAAEWPDFASQYTERDIPSSCELQFEGKVDSRTSLVFYIQYSKGTLRRRLPWKTRLDIKMTGDRVFGNSTRLVHSFWIEWHHFLRYTLAWKDEKRGWCSPIIGDPKPYMVPRHHREEGWHGCYKRMRDGHDPDMTRWKHSQIFRALMTMLASIEQPVEGALIIPGALATNRKVMDMLWEMYRSDQPKRQR